MTMGPASEARTDAGCYWPRAILHVDMNDLAASLEQRDFPELRGRPVGVTDGKAGTTLVACSWEARARGVRTGMNIHEARRLSPGIIQRPSRPRAYASTSARIMRALADLTSEIELFGLDQASLDITHYQRLHGSPERMAELAQQLVSAASGGLSCSIGVAGTRLTARYASEVSKPNGVTVIPPWEARERLRHVPVELLCGVGPRVGEFLARYGARTCGDVAVLPLNLLVRRYGVAGKHLWLACQGRDPGAVVQDVAPPKSVGHSKVLPPHTTSVRTIETYLRHMCERVAVRLRRLDTQAGNLHVGLRYERPNAGIEADMALPRDVPDGQRFFHLARTFFRDQWRGEAVIHVQVMAMELCSTSGQLELFTPDEAQYLGRLAAMDGITDKYPEFMFVPAATLEPAEASHGISPALRTETYREFRAD